MPVVFVSMCSLVASIWYIKSKNDKSYSHRQQLVSLCYYFMFLFLAKIDTYAKLYFKLHQFSKMDLLGEYKHKFEYA